MANHIAVGILLPLELGANGYFRQSFDILTQVRSNLINLLLTKKGERVFNPEFGCNIHNVLFENSSDETQAAVSTAIKEAVGRWLPYVTVENVQTVKAPDDNEITVTLTFSIRNNINVTDTITLVI